MKTILLTLATGLVSCSLFGQGAIVFVTRGGGVDAPVNDARTGTRVSGTAYLAQLYYGTSGAQESELVPVLNGPGGTVAQPAWFTSGALPGYILRSTGGGDRYTDPAIVAPGALTAFQVRVWTASSGRTWEEALTNLNAWSCIGKSSIIVVSTTTNAMDQPKYLIGLSAWTLCGLSGPELDDTPPLVMIGSPTNGQDFLSTDITLNGTAYDPTGRWPGDLGTGVSLVEVRVNGGGWLSATGTESWSGAVRLVFGTNLIEARCRDSLLWWNFGRTNYSSIESVTVTLLNHPPNTPTNLWPPSGETSQAVALTLQAGGFTDADEGDTHAASQWLVHRISDGVTVFDSGEDAVNKTSRAVPAGVLDYGTDYDWQVRFKDNRGAWSDYSTATFSTIAPRLQATIQGSAVLVAWPTNLPGFGLEYTTNLPGTNWTAVSPVPVVIGGQKVVTNTMTGGAGFYRLKKP